MEAADFVRQSVCEVWPDNWEAVMLFADCGTQWRIGMGGITGLDYTAVKTLLEIRQIPPDKWAEFLENIQIMEAAALEMIYQKEN